MTENCPCGIEFEIGDAPGAIFEIGDSGGASFEPGTPVIGGTKDYERLLNLPTINGRTIIGDKSVAYYLQDGLILNGGDATGYPAPVIPPGVPDAEGVMF